MPMPKGAMVEVTNDKVPWYGQVESYSAGVYTVKIGGTDVTVNVAEDSVKLHPAMHASEKLRQQRLTEKFSQLKAGGSTLHLIDGVFADFLGSRSGNKLADTIIGNPGDGAIMTLCNVNALLTLMWPSPAHVIVVDNDANKINDLNTLVEFAVTSETLLDWYCKVFERFGKKVLESWVSKYRPHYQNFLALKQSRSRLHIVMQDLSAENAVESIIKTCHCKCTANISMMYVSNIEDYLQLGPFCSDKEALPRYKNNILRLMQENTALIRGQAAHMQLPEGKLAMEKMWGGA